MARKVTAEEYRKLASKARYESDRQLRLAQSYELAARMEDK